MNARLLVGVVVLVLASGVAGHPSYSETLAKKYLTFAGAPYCYQSTTYDLSTWSVSETCQESCPDFVFKEKFYSQDIDAFGFVGYCPSDEFIVLTVKGTDPTHLADVVIDLKNLYAYKENCTFTTLSTPAHIGFCQEFHALRDLGILDTVLDLVHQFPSFEVVFTGHSLGASVAHLLAIEMMTTYNVPVAMYTYGQPRTGTSLLSALHDTLFKRFPTAALWRVTHYTDLVPHLPPCPGQPSGECQRDGLHGYHSGYQAHYPEDMSQPPTMCAKPDSVDCTETFDLSVQNHLYYFDDRVSQRCCPPDPQLLTDADDDVLHDPRWTGAPVVDPLPPSQPFPVPEAMI